MDHSEAVRMMASEKYLLDELQPEEVEAFEEHLFSCHECAMDVRAGSLFLEHSKVELASPRAVAAPSGWFAWCRPAFAVPAMALLLLVIGYQNLVTVPAAKRAVAENRSPRILTVAPTVSGITRVNGASSITINKGEPFFLPVEIPGQDGLQGYSVEFHNPAGGVEWSRSVSAEEIKNTLTILAPGVTQAGKYEVVVSGMNAQGQQQEVGRYPIELKFPGAANPKP